MKQVIVLALLLALTGCTRVVTYLEPGTGVEQGYCESGGDKFTYPYRCWAAKGQGIVITQKDGKEYTIRPEDGVMIFDNKTSPPRKAK